ncbi:MAG: hypothetical protein F6K62_10470 [Sphaerospermopsis sp. SIO1G2]|nr:hypothetical protein [Sphaerospermopsis sp. SIO1G2]
MTTAITYEIRQQLIRQLDQQLLEIRRDMLQAIEGVSAELANQTRSLDGSVPSTANEITPIIPEIFASDDTPLGNAVQRGIGNAVGRTIAGRTVSAQQIFRPVLRQLGRNLGNNVADSLFNQGGRGFRLGTQQFGGELLSGLFKSQRNQ